MKSAKWFKAAAVAALAMATICMAGCGGGDKKPAAPAAPAAGKKVEYIHDSVVRADISVPQRFHD